MAEPAEGPLHDPAPFQDDEAIVVRQFLDDAVAHAMDEAPFLAALGREGTVEDGQSQAGPRLLAIIESRERVAILQVRWHDGERQHVPFGIDQCDAFAPGQLLGSVITAWNVPSSSY